MFRHVPSRALSIAGPESHTHLNIRSCQIQICSFGEGEINLENIRNTGRYLTDN